VQNPTIPLKQITAAINLDMIGRLRNERVHVYGTRTSAGLRRLVSHANRDVNLLLDFTWEMSGDSDHHTFFLAGVPVIMYHTGLHDDYHRPSDDAPKINNDGIERISRLLFNSTAALADEPDQHRFRPQSR
jgi:Zn-dependent M28 family amino/carboxypeptidase